MNSEIERKAQSKAPIYGDYERTGKINIDGGRWIENFLKVFFYKLGFIICVEGLSKSGVAVVSWPILNASIAYGLKTAGWLDIKEYPIGLALFIEAMILFWWMNKSTAKKFILGFVGPAIKDIASAFKR